MGTSRFRPVSAVPMIFITILFLLFVADLKLSSANEINDIKNELREMSENVTLNIGPSPRNLNLAGISKDFFLDDNTAVFGTAGFDNMYIGAGVIYYTHGYRNDGLIYSTVAGFLPEISTHATVGYQMKVEGKHYVTAGVGIKTTAGKSIDSTLAVAYEYKF